MNIFKVKFSKPIAVTWLGIYLLLIGCTTGQMPTSTVPLEAEVPVTRSTSTSTVSLTQSATQPSPTQTPIPLITVTPEPGQTPKPTRTPPPPPWMIQDLSPFLFYNWGDDIYLVRPNGEQRFIANKLLLGGDPWSPDGLKFLFDPDPDIYPFSVSVANLTTGETQYLIEEIYGDIHWSPDGKYLFYVQWDINGPVGLTLYDLDQQSSELLLEISLETSYDIVFTAGWSPDSRQVAFIAKLNGQYDLYSIDIETRTQRQLTFSPQMEVLAAWSPVANELVVVTAAQELLLSEPFYAEKLQVIDETGTELAYLGPYEYLLTATWSPDGQRIAYSADEGLCVFNIADTVSNCPLQNTAYGRRYAIASRIPWSADSKWLAFQAVELPGLGCYQLFLLDLETETVIEPEGPCSVRSQIHWFPTVVQN